MIKKFVGFAGAWTLYYLGDWVHWPMIWFGWSWIYPIYNVLMTCSGEVQHWAGNTGPWRPYTIEDDKGEA